MSVLLPPPGTRALQIHDCGTMLEACDCVEFVCDAGNGEALMQLAEFLFAVEEEEAESLTGAKARDGERGRCESWSRTPGAGCWSATRGPPGRTHRTACGGWPQSQRMVLRPVDETWASLAVRSSAKGIP